MPDRAAGGDCKKGELLCDAAFSQAGAGAGQPSACRLLTRAVACAAPQTYNPDETRAFVTYGNPLAEGLLPMVGMAVNADIMVFRWVLRAACTALTAGDILYPAETR